MKGTIKSKHEIEQMASVICENEGYHMRGQFFPIENLIYCEQTFEFTQENKFCFSTKIKGVYHFFSIDSIRF